MNTYLQSESLNRLFSMIRYGKIQLPAFQRSFAWRDSNIVSLLGSVYQGQPIGLLLFWQTKGGALKTADSSLTGFPAAPKSSIVNFVIDGGHRLITLYNCFHQTDIKNRQSFDIVFDLDNETFQPKPGGKGKAKSDASFIPLTVALLPEAIKRIRQDTQVPVEVMNSRMSSLAKLQAQFQNYKVAIMTLADANLNDVILSFETLNTAGTKLTRSEIEKADAMRTAEAFELVFEGDRDQTSFIVDLLPVKRERSFDDGRRQPTGPHPRAELERVGKSLKVSWVTLPNVFKDLQADFERRIKKEYQSKIARKKTGYA